jgi:hypothetical protein
MSLWGAEQAIDNTRRATHTHSNERMSFRGAGECLRFENSSVHLLAIYDRQQVKAIDRVEETDVPR